MNAEVSRAAIRVRLKKEKDAEGDCAEELEKKERF